MRNVLDKKAPIATVEKRFENLKEAFQNVTEKHNEFIVLKGVDVSQEDEDYMNAIMESFDDIEIETDSFLLECRDRENNLQNKKDSER